MLHLEEADKETLTGAESRLKEMVARRNFVTERVRALLATWCR